MTTQPFYEPAPAQPSSDIGISQESFLENFQALYNAFSVNHVPLDAASDAGNHNFLNLAPQAGPIDINIGEIGLYAQNVEDQTNQIMLGFQNNSYIAQYTNYQIYSLNQTANLSRYFTTLPGGIIVYFGIMKFGVASQILKLLPAIATNIISVSCWPYGTTASVCPWVTIQKNSANNIYDQVTFNNSSFLVAPASINYVILANT